MSAYPAGSIPWRACGKHIDAHSHVLALRWCALDGNSTSEGGYELENRFVAAAAWLSHTDIMHLARAAFSCTQQELRQCTF